MSVCSVGRLHQTILWVEHDLPATDMQFYVCACAEAEEKRMRLALLVAVVSYLLAKTSCQQT